MRYCLAVICLILFSAALFADSPVASVSSSEPFSLRGAEVQVHGVPSWPVFAGDVIVAGKAPAMLKFGCGSLVRLNPGTEAHVSIDGSKVTVHIAKGDLTYKLSKGCPLMIAGVTGAPVAAALAVGTATLVNGAVILAPLAAGGAAYGFAQAGGDSSPSVSPK